MWCCVDDGGLWPSGAALHGEASNHLMLRWLKTVVVSDEEKARGVRWGPGRRSLRKRPEIFRRHRNRGVQMVPGGAWWVPADWPGGARRRGEVTLACWVCVEREKARLDTAALVRDGEREAPGRLKP